MTDSNKRESVRTKIKKTERVEVRCTKAFKESLQEIAVQNNISITALIESICTDKIKEYYNQSSVQVKNNKPKKQPQQQKSKKDVELEASKSNEPPASKRKKYENEIWRMLSEGATPTETAKWLNENNFKPQRGDQFTMNSVHSIRQRLKKKRGK
ncbi:recombinase family protein [Photobacterium sp. ZSDE20]|nr:recombinase family protein [Photobacterium sp. ZSDE20]